jgi:hypothetical protein
MISHYKRSQSPTYVAVIAIIFIIWFSLTYSYWTLPPEIIARLGNYLQIVTLTIFMTTCIITVLSFKYQNDDRRRQIGLQYANLTQGTITEIERLFMSSSLLDRLYFQIYAHDPKIQYIKKMQGDVPVSLAMLKMEHHASNFIFQKMADIYAFDDLRLSNDDNIEWLNIFRAWMQSPILRSHWATFKYEQHPEFRAFVETHLIKNNKFIPVTPN